MSLISLTTAVWSHRIAGQPLERALQRCSAAMVEEALRVLEPQGAATLQDSRVEVESAPYAQPLSSHPTEGALLSASALNNVASSATSSTQTHQWPNSPSHARRTMRHPAIPSSSTQHAACASLAPVSTFATHAAASDVRYSDLISRCQSLRELFQMVDEHRDGFRSHHWAFLMLRAAQLFRQFGNAGSSQQHVKSGLTQLQVAVLQSINLEQCSITDLDNILHSWRLRIGDPPPDVLATIVQLLRPLPAHTPPGAAASHASPASSAPSEAWGATPLPAAGNKLRSANGRTLTSLTQSLLALKVIGPKAAYREVADDLVRAIAAASVRRAEECSFTSLAHLAQALTSCSWGDAAVYRAIATAAVGKMHSASLSDTAWLTHTLTKPSVFSMLEPILQNALLQTAADHFSQSVAATEAALHPASPAVGEGGVAEGGHSQSQAKGRVQGMQLAHSGRLGMRGSSGGGASVVQLNETTASILRMMEVTSITGMQHTGLVESCVRFIQRWIGTGQLPPSVIAESAELFLREGLNTPNLYDRLHAACLALVDQIMYRATGDKRFDPQPHFLKYRRLRKQESRGAASDGDAHSQGDTQRQAGSDVRNGDGRAGGRHVVLPGAVVVPPTERIADELVKDHIGLTKQEPSSTGVAPMPSGWAPAGSGMAARGAGGRACAPSDRSRVPYPLPACGSIAWNSQVAAVGQLVRATYALLHWPLAAPHITRESRVELIESVLGLVLHMSSSKQHHAQAIPLLAEMAHICALPRARVLNERLVSACLSSLKLILQDPSTSASSPPSTQPRTLRLTRPASRHPSATAPSHLSDHQRALLSLKLMQAVSALKAVRGNHRNPVLSGTGDLNNCAYRLWGAQAPHMTPGQLIDMLEVVNILGHSPLKTAIWPVLGQLGAFAASLEGCSAADLMTPRNAHHSQASDYTVGRLLGAVGRLAGRWAGGHSQGREEAWDEEGEVPLFLKAQRLPVGGRASFDGAAGVRARANLQPAASAGSDQNQNQAVGAVWSPTARELMVLHQTLLHQQHNFASVVEARTAMASAMGKTAPAEALLEAAARVWAAAQPIPNKSLTQDLTRHLDRLGWGQVWPSDLPCGLGLAQAGIVLDSFITSPRGAAQTKNGRARSAHSNADKQQPTVVVVEVLPRTCSPMNAPLEILGHVSAHARWLMRGRNPPMVYVPITLAEWDLAGPDRDGAVRRLAGRMGAAGRDAVRSSPRLNTRMDLVAHRIKEALGAAESRSHQNVKEGAHAKVGQQGGAQLRGSEQGDARQKG